MDNTKIMWIMKKKTKNTNNEKYALSGKKGEGLQSVTKEVGLKL